MFVVSSFIAKRFPKRKYICCKMISFFNLISSKASDATPYGKAMSDEDFFFNSSSREKKTILADLVGILGDLWGACEECRGS
jgi:hypothetical protein